MVLGSVENASFMPWLVGTALIHSLAVTERRGLFKSWTLLLAISAFSLSLLGTFLVRSGILVSVHAFATDPTRGMFILAFPIDRRCAGALRLASAGPRLERGVPVTVARDVPAQQRVAGRRLHAGADRHALSAPVGRARDGQGLDRPPWFSRLALPMLPLVFDGVGMHTAWRQRAAGGLVTRLRLFAVVAVVVGMLIPTVIYGRFGALVAGGSVAAVWLLLASAEPVWRSLRREKGTAGITRNVLNMSVARWRRALRARRDDHLGIQYRDRPQHAGWRDRRGRGLRVRTPRAEGRRRRPELRRHRRRDRHHPERRIHRPVAAAEGPTASSRIR